MKTNLLRVIRDQKLRNSFNYGKWRAGYMHVSTSPKAQIRDALESMMASPKGWRVNLAREYRDQRRACYLGQFSALRQERRMMNAFSL